MKRKIFNLKFIAVLFLIFAIVFSLSGEIKAAEVTDEIAREAGLSVGSAASSSVYDEGKYIGELYFMIDKFSVDGEYICEPYSIPLYKGESLTSILNYQLFAKDESRYIYRPYYHHLTNRNYFYTGENQDILSGYVNYKVPEDGFKLKDISEVVFKKGNLSSKPGSLSSEPEEVNYSKLIKDYAAQNSYSLESKYPRKKFVDFHDGGPFNYIGKGQLNQNSKWYITLNGNEITDLSAYKAGENISDGDVFRISFSIFGDDRGYESGADRMELLKEIAEVNSFNDSFFLFEDANYKKVYDDANAVLKDLSADQDAINNAAVALKNKPAINQSPDKAYNFVNYEGQGDAPEDFLLSNLHYTMKTGEEMELFCLDIMRASDMDANYQRADLRFEPIVGADKIEIKRDSGEKIDILSSSFENVQDGNSYYLRALKEGFVKLKVTYPGYKGRPNYIDIYISNRESDYGMKRIPMKSNLDEIIKYDCIHYTTDEKDFALNFKVESGATPTVYGNGEKIDLTSRGTISSEGNKYDVYEGSISLKNFSNEVIFTAEKSGTRTSKIYNFRSAFITFETVNLDRKGEPVRLGDKFKIVVNGMLVPLPKIGKFYNPWSAKIKYFSEFPNAGLVQIGDETESYKAGGKVARPKAVQLTATKSGEIKFTDGYISTVGFGKIAAWDEVPRNQMPEYKPNRVKEVISNVGGQNVAQRDTFYYAVPDFSIYIEDNPEYKPKNLIKAVSDKESYKPGDIVTLSIDISDRKIKIINKQHNNYIEPYLPDGSENLEHNHSDQIDIGRIIYTTNIPGLDVVMTDPPVDTKVKDNDEKLERLKRLRTLKFEIPEGTPDGEYELRGVNLQVFAGPIWGQHEKSYFNNMFDSVKIKVDRNASSTEVIVLPKLTELIISGEDLVSPEDGRVQISGYMKAKTKGDKVKIKFTGENIDEVSIERYENEDTLLREKLTANVAGYYTAEIPLKSGKNKIDLLLHNRKSNSGKSYTLEIERVEETEDTDHINKSKLKDAILSAESLNRDDYDARTWQEILKLKKRALEISADENATQSQVDEIAEYLRKAILSKKHFENKNWEIMPVENLYVNGEMTKDDILFRLPSYGLLTDEDGNSREVKLQWRLNNYDSSKSGEYVALGFYEDPVDGSQRSVECKIFVEGKGEFSDKRSEIIYIEQPSKISGIKGEALNLPRYVTAKLKDGSYRSLNVNWDISTINTNQPGIYYLQGKTEFGRGVNLQLEILENKNYKQEISSDNKKTANKTDTKPQVVSEFNSSMVKSSNNYGGQFTDVETHWAYKAIEYVTDMGYFYGISESEFAPDKYITKAEFTTILARISGISPENYKKAQAKDLKASEYYYGYANWAIAEGIYKTDKNQKFKGDAFISRAEMALGLSGTLKYIGRNLAGAGRIFYEDTAGFSDETKEAISLLSVNNILKGRGDNKFYPHDKLTRAEAAQILYNLDH